MTQSLVTQLSNVGDSAVAGQPRWINYLWSCLTFLLVLGLGAGSAHADEDAELLKEFRRYYKKYEDNATRVEAIRSLSGGESEDLVNLLCTLFSGAPPEIYEALVDVLSDFDSAEAVEYLCLALDSKAKPEVRLGVLDALGRGAKSDLEDGGQVGKAAYRRYRPEVFNCLSDKDWRVRRATLTALQFQGPLLAPPSDPGEPGEPGGKATKPKKKKRKSKQDPYREDPAVGLLECTQDKELAVRGAALDALAQWDDERVLEPARMSLLNDSWQLRSSAIACLGEVRHRDSIGPLIDCMEREEGRLREDCAAALEALTGRFYALNVEGWRKFWDSYSDRYQIPTDEELDKLLAKRKETAKLYRPSGSASFAEVDTPSRRLVYVVDVSGSMEQELVNRDAFLERKLPNYQRIEILKSELLLSIEQLEPYVEFNILAFATEVKSWKKGLVKANVLNRSSAVEFVTKLEAIGGSSNNDLARAGLTGSANLAAGKTNSYGALMQGLGIEISKKSPAASTPSAKSGSYEVELDTLFFLSDGRPSAGKFTEPADIMREVRRVNELRKVVIHTIGIGEFERTFMVGLASENGGRFVDLGK